MGLAAYPMAEAGSLRPLAALLGGLGLVFMAMGLARYGGLCGAAVFCLAGEYVLVDASGRVPVASVIVYSPVLVAFAELLFWTATMPSGGLADPAVVLSRARIVAATCAAAVLLAFTTLAPMGTHAGGAFQLAVLGSIASVALLALPWWLMRTARR